MWIAICPRCKRMAFAHKGSRRPSGKINYEMLVHFTGARATWSGTLPRCQNCDSLIVRTRNLSWKRLPDINPSHDASHEVELRERYDLLVGSCNRISKFVADVACDHRMPDDVIDKARFLTRALQRFTNTDVYIANEELEEEVLGEEG